MKPHVKVQVRPGVRVTSGIPYWESLITDKSIARQSLLPSVDRVFARYGVPFWSTHEYRSSGSAYSAAEIQSGLDRIYRLVLQRDESVPPELVRDVALLPEVEYVHVGDIGTAHLPQPEAAAMSVTTDLRSRQAIHLPEAHVYTRGDPSITVAVLDTGVEQTHRELADAIVPGHNFVDIIDGNQEFIGHHLGADAFTGDEVGHGTHVAGIIAAAGTSMPVGVAPRCRIMPVRVLGALQKDGRIIGAGLIDNINAGLKYAIDRGADVINMSLGVRPEGSEVPHKEMVDYAQRKGVTIVAASGNDGSSTNQYYPGALPYVVTVGALDEVGDVAAFSTYGEHVDLVAPGTNIYSSFLKDGYAFSTGTSHSTPFVAGAMALLRSYARQHGRDITDAQLKFILRSTADRLGTRLRDRRWGSGLLNLVDAVRLLDHKLRNDGEEQWLRTTTRPANRRTAVLVP